MNKQSLLEMKIELALTKTATEVLLYTREKLTWSEVLKKMEETKQDLYKSIASMEPKHESEVV